MLEEAHKQNKLSYSTKQVQICSKSLETQFLHDARVRIMQQIFAAQVAVPLRALHKPLVPVSWLLVADLSSGRHAEALFVRPVHHY